MWASFLLILGLLPACKTAPECVDNGDCTGSLEACIADKCRPVECKDSTTCGLHAFCDTRNDTYTCKQGCQVDGDCLAGEECNTEAHKCVSYGCRNTTLDCEVGQVCNESTATCEDDPRAHCKPCSFTGSSPCGSRGQCFQFEAGDTSGYCLMECRPADADCPAGFGCEDVSGYGDWYCFAWCPYLDDNGWI